MVRTFFKYLFFFCFLLLHGHFLSANAGRDSFRYSSSVVSASPSEADAGKVQETFIEKPSSSGRKSDSPEWIAFVVEVEEEHEASSSRKKAKDNVYHIAFLSFSFSQRSYDSKSKTDFFSDQHWYSRANLKRYLFLEVFRL